MKKTHRRVLLSMTALALTTTMWQPGTAVAAGHGTPQIRTTINVVATGLDVPRGVFFDRHTGRVLVAEAGEGGPSLQQGGTCGLANGGARYCIGNTGAIYSYREFGQSGRIVESLPSIANYDAATGLTRRSVLGIHDLNIHNGKLNAIFGLSGRQGFRDNELGAAALPLAQTVRISSSGAVTPVGDLVAFEETQNPHTSVIDSDPYGSHTDNSGTIVADAAGNTVLRVSDNGTVELLATLPNRDLPEFNDFIESVPTTVVKGPDGAYYIGELTGFPYYKGYAQVWRLVPGQAPTVHATGFTNIADITFDDRGRLIVLEMAREGLFAGAPGHNGDILTGQLIRVEHNGTRTVLASEGLRNPGGVAYVGTALGYSLFYVTNGTAGVGNDGELLRVLVKG